MDDQKTLNKLVDEAEKLCKSLSGKDAESCRKILKQLSAFADSFIDFRMILNGLNEQFFITDAKEKTLFVNDAYCNASKLRNDLLVGKTVTELVEKDHYFTNPIIPKVIKEKKGMQEIAQVQTQRESVCLIGTPIFDSEGNLRYAVSNDYRPEDITSLQVSFARFSEQNELLKKSAEIEYYKQYTGANRDYHFADPEMIKLVELVKSIGHTDVTVLITGESGTGKEVIADLLCKNSSRAEKPFIKVNCAAIPENLIESELFGYEKGAFTGADKNGKIGMMELADKGTIFLDEIGEIPLSLQSKLLRALQEKVIRRIGGIKEIPIDIRILAATNRDLKNEVREGRFREDLYYRLNVIPVQLPPLRERPADIRHLTSRLMEEYTSHYHKSIRLDEGAILCLQKYSWPGNIRELKNVLERLVITNTSGIIGADVINEILGIKEKDTSFPVSVPEEPVSPQDLNMKDARERLETALIKKALSLYGSKRQAAKALGIDHSTLVVKCQKYNIG